MTANTVAGAIAVVNADLDDAVSHGCNDLWVASIQERVRWILDNRFGGNASRMSLARGLVRSHIGRILDRSRDGQEPIRILDDTARKIAQASGVTVHWLLDGTEPRDATDTRSVDEEQYPARGAAVRAAQALGTISQEAIQEIATAHYQHEAASSMTADDWFEEIRGADRRLRRGLLPQTREHIKSKKKP